MQAKGRRFDPDWIHRAIGAAVSVAGLHPVGRGFESLIAHNALVVEWYTRQSQKLLPLRDCEFESHREHLYGI